MNKKILNLSNPWIDCGSNWNEATQISGFSFDTKLDSSKYVIRAMKGIIEIIYNLDNKKILIIRKAKKLENHDIKIGLAGVYDSYPIEKDIVLDNGVSIRIGMDENNKIYIATTSNDIGYYSLYCKEGMDLKELEDIYKKIEELSSNKIDYSNCELGDLVGDDVERIYIKGFYIDYHSHDYTEKEAQILADSCFKENVKNQYELDCCLRHKMFPEIF